MYLLNFTFTDMINQHVNKSNTEAKSHVLRNEVQAQNR